MVKLSPGLDRAFQALGDPTRRAILERLSRGEATVSELAAPLPMSMPAVLKHIGVLEAAGLMRCEKVGRVRSCRLNLSALDQPVTWLERRRQTWTHRLDTLASHIEEKG